MKVLIFEDNLMWAPRLKLSVEGLGHQALVISRLPAEGEELPLAEAAILNLGASAFKPESLAPRLREGGIWVVGHAGHKEKPLLDLGTQAGCDLVVSNSTLTFKMDQVLAQAEEALRARQ